MVREKYPNAQNGDIVITCPNKKRYRNDHTYHYIETCDEICVLPLLGSDVDDYGHCNNLLKVKPNEPINKYCIMSARNSFWWPSDELRNFIKTQKVIEESNIKYVDIIDNGNTFRFFIDKHSDIDNGIFIYHPEEYESSDGNHYCDSKEFIMCSIDKMPIYFDNIEEDWSEDDKHKDEDEDEDDDYYDDDDDDDV